MAIFSSNYPLNGDLSAPVMETLQIIPPRLEIYSIDEMFLYLEGFQDKAIHIYGQQIKNTVYQHTALGVGVGIKKYSLHLGKNFRFLTVKHKP